MSAQSPPAHTPRTAFLARRRRALLLSCAVGAASLLMARPAPAPGQAINGTYTPVAGNLTRTTGPNTETITVSPTFNDSTTAIINWTANAPVTGTSWDFLPQGNTVTFQGAVGRDFAVLNRVLIPVPIEFNGRVVSQLQQAGGGTARGGTVIFTNAAGIVVGPTAVFDVGNLVLSTLSVTTTDESGYGPYFNPSDLSFTLGSGDPHATVETLAGAQINAPADGSYFAMVAPRVVHGGTATVNGSTAYVAAEAVELRINNGLFDIIVGTGSDNPDPLTHTGTTGGPASTGAGDNQRIYMVAVPKNQAITALLSGNVGFDAATDVTVENGEIILSAGYSVFGNVVATDSPPTGTPPPEANFFVRQGT
ncbi:MAG TPA: histidine kinase, partial [Allosphingosinicella sp.]|nr:histidine kinase [Allosphingosinicella sp.]